MARIRSRSVHDATEKSGPLDHITRLPPHAAADLYSLAAVESGTGSDDAGAALELA